MINKVQKIISSYQETQQILLDQAGTLDHQRYGEISKDLARRKQAYELACQYQQLTNQITEAKDIIAESKDEEMLELAKEELATAQEALPAVQEKLKIALLPQDPRDDKNVYLEIRPAAGGDESSLFAQELLRMYMMYAQLKGRRIETVEHQNSDVGGLKFAMLKISGQRVYSRLKFESGVHRVQRIPQTESSGRIHTSTVTVAIMPEAEDLDVHLDIQDVILDTYAASSAGGQNANKNQTGVRLHHKPTGIIVTIGDSKSQLQNKEKAFAVLRAKLYQQEMDAKMAEEQAERQGQIGTGDRSEKIRTYNFPQDRVTDHRIKRSGSNLPGMLDGNIQDMIDALMMDEQVRLLQAAT